MISCSWRRLTGDMHLPGGAPRETGPHQRPRRNRCKQPNVRSTLETWPCAGTGIGLVRMEKSPDNPRLKQPYFIYPTDRSPLFFAALCATDPEVADSFVIITAANHDGLSDIHDRRPLALPAAAARDWLDSRLIPPPGDMLADIYSLQAESFAWQPVSSDVGTVRNDSASLIVAIDTPKV